MYMYNNYIMYTFVYLGLCNNEKKNLYLDRPVQ